MSGRPWTAAEDAYITSHVASESLAQIAVVLGRTEGSVRAARARLGLRKRLTAAHFPTPRPGHRFCTRCQVQKPVGEFHGKGLRRTGACGDCRGELQRERLYGITEDEYQALLAAQDGVCAICRQPETNTYRTRTRRLAVDHDHRTGQRRALLRSACNMVLGLVDDDPDRLLAAAAYLGQKRAKSLGLTNVIPDSWNS